MHISHRSLLLPALLLGGLPAESKLVLSSLRRLALTCLPLLLLLVAAVRPFPPARPRPLRHFRVPLLGYPQRIQGRGQHFPGRPAAFDFPEHLFVELGLRLPSVDIVEG